jgi:acid stress-induced BolA-like protein IbaG/YrbA
MVTREQLQEVLRAMPSVEEATVVEDRRLIATVVSGAFREKDEGERQAVVYAYIFDRLGTDAFENIEFIFTNTPEEEKENAA